MHSGTQILNQVKGGKMTTRVHFLVASSVVLVAFWGTSVRAQTCVITDPTASPIETWIALNGETISFTHSGGFSYHQIRIYDSINGTEYFKKQYYTHTAPSNTNGFSVPVAVVGATRQCKVEVVEFDIMNTPVASDVVNLDIYTN